MKESYFQYALIVLVILFGVSLFVAICYIIDLHSENAALKQENQQLEETIDGISDEIRVLSDRIEEIVRDARGAENWNEESH